MFKMMNEARIAVGFGASMIGYRGYQYSLDYAKDRTQGRIAPNNKPEDDATEIDLNECAFVEKGVLINSNEFSGLSSAQAWRANLLATATAALFFPRRSHTPRAKRENSSSL